MNWGRSVWVFGVLSIFLGACGEEDACEDPDACVEMTFKGHLEPCYGLFFGVCYATVDESGMVVPFTGEIEGYQFEWGFDSELLVKVRPRGYYLADGPSEVHRVEQVLGRTPVPEGTEFDWGGFAPSTTPAEAQALFTGDCVQGYTLSEADLAKALVFDGDLTCAEFEAALDEVPESIKFRFVGPGAALTVVSVTPRPN